MSDRHDEFRVTPSWQRTEVAEQFGLTVDDVHWARSYELSRRTPAAA